MKSFSILRTNDNYIIINKWANKLEGGGYYTATDGYVNYNSKNGYLNSDRVAFDVISFEEFKSTILKETPLEPVYSIY